MKALKEIGEFGYLLWRTLLSLRYMWRDRGRVLYQLDHLGIHSIPLVLVIGLFAGAIIAWQAAYQFKGMVSMSVLGGQVSRVLMMEMAPVLTALVISGRIGASMAAEIASMKVSEQIDALRTMSIDPVRYLVMPRFVSLTIMMPILTLFALCIAMIGAYGVCNYFLSISSEIFFGSVKDFFDSGDLFGGLLKSAFFGILISLAGCFRGLFANIGSKGVGDATISAFVTSAICILAGDFLFWIILF